MTLDRGTLRVKGETKGSKDGHSFHYSVEKMITLPQGVIDAEAVEATNEHGMLVVCIPKKQQQQMYVAGVSWRRALLLLAHTGPSA